jgi:DNA-binding MarR family transcriptional regulator
VQLPSTTQRFTRGFWKLRQKLFKDIGGKLRSVYGVELSHVHVLRYISKGNITPSQLVEEMQIPAHGISRILEALEAQGFLERTLNPNDARKRRLTITKEGTRVLKLAEVVIEKEMKSLLSVFSKKDLEQFLKYLETLTKES